MQLSSIQTALPLPPPKATDSAETRQKFDEFVGQSFYSQLLSGMRKTVGKPAYFHGGAAEEVFQGQLDQKLVQELSKSGAAQFSEPLFQLFNLPRNK